MWSCVPRFCGLRQPLGVFVKNKYIFFRRGYKPICIALYTSDEDALESADGIERKIGETVTVCRHLTPRAGDGARCTCPSNTLIKIIDGVCAWCLRPRA